MPDILKKLADTAEYFRDDDGGDVIGAHACEDAIAEIKKLRAKIRRDADKLQQIGDALGIPAGTNRLDWLLEQARAGQRKER